MPSVCDKKIKTADDVQQDNDIRDEAVENFEQKVYVDKTKMQKLDEYLAKKFGSDYLKISAIMFPAFPLFFIANATFQGLKKAIIVMYMAIMRFVLFPIIVVSIIYFQIEENYNYIFFGLASMHWTIGIIYFFYCNQKFKKF